MSKVFVLFDTMDYNIVGVFTSYSSAVKSAEDLLFSRKIDTTNWNWGDFYSVEEAPYYV